MEKIINLLKSYVKNNKISEYIIDKNIKKRKNFYYILNLENESFLETEKTDIEIKIYKKSNEYILISNFVITINEDINRIEKKLIFAINNLKNSKIKFFEFPKKKFMEDKNIDYKKYYSNIFLNDFKKI